MLQSLREAGMTINVKKSVLEPSQTITHLGFQLDLKGGFLQVPTGKLKGVRKELGKIVTHSEMSCRKMAAILGVTRSFLTAMPFLRAFSDHMVAFVNQQENQGWDKKFPVPENLVSEVEEIRLLMKNWKGRTFGDKVSVRCLHSDSSDKAWAGIDTKTGVLVQEFWRENSPHKGKGAAGCNKHS